MINFNNLPTKIITVKELEKLYNEIGLRWYDFKHVSIIEREEFENKTNAAFEPTNDGKVKLYDLNYNWDTE